MEAQAHDRSRFLGRRRVWSCRKVCTLSSNTSPLTRNSTEWVEDYIPWLKNAVVSYLNVDVAVSGPIPGFDGTPDLHKLATDISKKVIWPFHGSYNSTMYDIWEQENGEIGVLGSGSDYTAFLHRGIGSIDIGAGGGRDDPVYHYHSNYDSYHWMANFGDPGFLTHKGIGQYLTLLAYHLANDESLPLEPADYTPELKSYFTDLQATIKSHPAPPNTTLNLSPLSTAISTFTSAAINFNALRSLAISASNSALIKVCNLKARDFSRGFTSQGGLPGREFFQHMIFAPGVDTGYAPVTFPGVTEAVMAGRWSEAVEYLERTARAIELAAAILKT